ncbi:hypothetical protein ACTTAM_14270 [Rhodobacter capsulatus]|uniref:hypothetical protein n=1 Tax=Rhodobacter capsulatus TaxID=1061 RepID=UPI00402522D0
MRRLLALIVLGLSGCTSGPPEITADQAARIAAPDPALAAQIARLMPALRAEERARDARALSEGGG